ncbi:MAG: hypothetical protein CM1200mP36_01970 [Gammaproteobacteria bacterium]|nr:MAG: hypothetical protein CM1200mP36_01970 [Gammaproteobacteria bacterium]
MRTEAFELVDTEILVDAEDWPPSCASFEKIGMKGGRSCSLAYQRPLPPSGFRLCGKRRGGAQGLGRSVSGFHLRDALATLIRKPWAHQPLRGARDGCGAHARS